MEMYLCSSRGWTCRTLAGWLGSSARNSALLCSSLSESLSFSTHPSIYPLASRSVCSSASTLSPVSLITVTFCSCSSSREAWWTVEEGSARNGLFGPNNSSYGPCPTHAQGHCTTHMLSSSRDWSSSRPTIPSVYSQKWDLSSLRCA